MKSQPFMYGLPSNYFNVFKLSFTLRKSVVAVASSDLILFHSRLYLRINTKCFDGKPDFITSLRVSWVGAGVCMEKIITGDGFMCTYFTFSSVWGQQSCLLQCFQAVVYSQSISQCSGSFISYPIHSKTVEDSSPELVQVVKFTIEWDSKIINYISW